MTKSKTPKHWTVKLAKRIALTMDASNEKGHEGFGGYSLGLEEALGKKYAPLYVVVQNRFTGEVAIARTKPSRPVEEATEHVIGAMTALLLALSEQTDEGERPAPCTETDADANPYEGAGATINAGIMRGMDAYLSVCSSGGMSTKKINQVRASVEEAAYHDYFVLNIAHELADHGKHLSVVDAEDSVKEPEVAPTDASLTINVGDVGKADLPHNPQPTLYEFHAELLKTAPPSSPPALALRSWINGRPVEAMQHLSVTR